MADSTLDFTNQMKIRNKAIQFIKIRFNRPDFIDFDLRIFWGEYRIYNVKLLELQNNILCFPPKYLDDPLMLLLRTIQYMSNYNDDYLSRMFYNILVSLHPNLFNIQDHT